MTNNLEYLCEGICEMAGIASPALQEEEEGVMAFNVVWRDVAVDVVFQPANSASHVFVVFEMGDLGEAGQASWNRMQALLRANFVFRAKPPISSCHPESRVALLQYAGGH